MNELMRPRPPAPPQVPPELLYRTCPLDQLPFETTADLEPIDDGIGQKRAAAAVHVALGMKHGGYNLFALGPVGTGKYAFVRKALERASASWPVPRIGATRTISPSRIGRGRCVCRLGGRGRCTTTSSG
jgi:hypothetical protein